MHFIIILITKTVKFYFFRLVITDDATEVDVVFTPGSPREGQEVSIECQANGNPAPDVSKTFIYIHPLFIDS